MFKALLARFKVYLLRRVLRRCADVQLGFGRTVSLLVYTAGF
jgi:hypothetical protein